MGAIYVYEPTVVSFTNESTLTINHNFGRDVNVQIYDENSQVMGAKIFKDSGDNNTVKASFLECGELVSVSGKVVVS